MGGQVHFIAFSVLSLFVCPSWQFLHSTLPCEVILGFDCTSFFGDVDQRTCDNKGNLHNNFCDFDQAHCRDNSITVDYSRLCLTAGHATNPTTQKQPQTSILLTTLKPTAYPSTQQVPDSTTASTKLSTIQPSTQSATSATYPTTKVSTAQPTSATTSSTEPTSPTTISTNPTTTSQLPTTTTDDYQGFVSILCQFKDIMACTGDPNKVCGSDGVTYANTCEFSKKQCDDKSLQIAHNGEC